MTLRVPKIRANLRDTRSHLYSSGSRRARIYSSRDICIYIYTYTHIPRCFLFSRVSSHVGQPNRCVWQYRAPNRLSVFTFLIPVRPNRPTPPFSSPSVVLIPNRKHSSFYLQSANGIYIYVNPSRICEFNGGNDGKLKSIGFRYRRRTQNRGKDVRNLFET